MKEEESKSLKLVSCNLLTVISISLVFCNLIVSIATSLLAICGFAIVLAILLPILAILLGLVYFTSCLLFYYLFSNFTSYHGYFTRSDIFYQLSAILLPF